MTSRTYARERDRLSSHLVRLEALAEQQGEGGVARAARALDEKLAEERFNVVVVGEVKRGKTTFVNALLGAEVLPAAVVPLTSVVTAVTWGDEVRAEVAFLDGRVEQVAPKDLPAYITEPGNPENRLGVERAVLFYPVEELHDGVFLVDTPGVGSVYAHNTEAARAYVPEADAAIFLTSADPPIGESERTFLEEVRGEASHMFFILNKIDYLSEPDQSEALAFTRGVLEESLGRSVRLYAVSARGALEAKLAGDTRALLGTDFAAFERDFRKFLLRDKGRTILDSVAGHARRLVTNLRNSIDVEERAARLPQEELAGKIEEMEAVFSRASEWRDDMHALLRKERDRFVEMLEGDLAELRAHEEETLFATANDFLAGTGDLRGAASELNEVVRPALRSDVDRWRRAEDSRIGDAFRSATARLVEETGHRVEETIRLCGDILGIRLSSSTEPVDLSRETRFTYSFFEVPTILESLLPDVRRYLPKQMARRLLERDISEQIPRLVDKHSGRLRYDFVQRLDQSCRTLERTLDERLASTIESLRRGVGRSRQERARGADQVRLATERVRGWRRELDELERSLGTAAGEAAHEEVSV
jgi:GTPase SAR1 family protein